MKVVVVWKPGIAYGDEVFHAEIVLVAKDMEKAKTELSKRLLKNVESKLLTEGSISISLNDYNFSTLELIE